MIEFALNLILNIIIVTFGLWVGMKLMQLFMGTGLSGGFCRIHELSIAATAAILVSFVPYIGFILSWVVLIALLIKFVEESIGAIILMVFTGKLASFLAIGYLGLLL